LEAAAVVAIATADGFDVGVRFEGFQAGVVAQRDRLSHLGRCDVLKAGDATHFWQRHDAVRTSGPLKLKIAALPNAIEMVSKSVVAPLLDGLTDGGFVWYPTFGVGFITGTPIDDERSAAAIESARQVLTAARGSLTIQAAPAAIRQRISAWGEPAGTLPLMQATKQRFDPGRRLAPGRFVGGI
jgi:glycolate oxidase FAD binding subunit